MLSSNRLHSDAFSVQQFSRIRMLARPGTEKERGQNGRPGNQVYLTYLAIPGLILGIFFSCFYGGSLVEPSRTVEKAF